MASREKHIDLILKILSDDILKGSPCEVPGCEYGALLVDDQCERYSCHAKEPCNLAVAGEF